MAVSLSKGGKVSLAKVASDAGIAAFRDDVDIEPIDYTALLNNVSENTYVSIQSLVESFCGLLNNVSENLFVSRQSLVETFCGLFPTNTAGENCCVCRKQVVTFGDVFKLQYCKEFFLDKKNKLPMITGITELGKVILDDAKNFDTMLIAGKPRSGKSWYVLSVLMSLMLFNSPEDVQFIIVDPKKSNLFQTMALMPHVMGLHDDSNILAILDDIIEVEAQRRKKLLNDNKCDDIWALRSKGINLPILYLVIDEYMTVIGKLDEDKDKRKEFDNKIRILISQLPSQGIRLIFVPHRATGVVDKTNRTMLQFTAAVRADKETVEDTLGIQKWDRALTKPGDIAIKTSSMQGGIYIKGAALTTTDEENTKLIESAAKVFYKMGVDIPDMKAMRVAYNRNENHIKEELGASGNRVQFNADSLREQLDNIENMNFSDI